MQPELDPEGGVRGWLCQREGKPVGARKADGADRQHPALRIENPDATGPVAGQGVVEQEAARAPRNPAVDPVRRRPHRITRRDMKSLTFAGLDVVPYELSVDADLAKSGILAFSGASRRIGSSEDESEGLTDKQIADARETFRLSRDDQKLPKTVNPRIYRQVSGRRPLLILRLVKPKLEATRSTGDALNGVLAWGLSFPSSQIGGGTVEYIVNTIRMREMFGEEEIEEEALGDAE